MGEVVAVVAEAAAAIREDGETDQHGCGYPRSRAGLSR
jgi:hypothetical protein